MSSGYRSPQLNRAIGGSPSSAHLQALAADLYLRPSRHADNLLIAITLHSLNLPFDYLIYERATATTACLTACRWVHLALAPAGRPARQQTLRTDPPPGPLSLTTNRYPTPIGH